MGGSTGRVEIVDKSGNITWYHEDEYMHHDICPLPNGNIIFIVYDPKTSTEITAAGGSASTQSGPTGPGGSSSSSAARYYEKLIEINPQTNEIVWEWHLWDHLCQNSNSSYSNYVSSISEHPELMNINYNTSNTDWFHLNGVDYNEYRDQIIFSSHYMNEIYVIDHSTTTAEAATHTGGNSGHGGDFLYRWGNPAAYGMSGTTNFNVVHDGHMGAQGTPYENYLVGYNNKGGTNSKSAVDRIIPPFSDDAKTAYTLSTTTYSPASYSWRYSLSSANDSKGNSQELPNGNTLVCNTSYIYELDPNNSTIWYYSGSGTMPQAFRYSECYVNNTMPATPSITASGNVLTCSVTGESYQWFLNSYMISGATAKTYTATVSGIYQVQIRNSSDCNSFISAKYNHTMAGEAILPTSVSVSLASSTIELGATTTATQTVLPVNASNPSITWSSSNESVATVNQNGVVTAVGVGSANIIATCAANSSISGYATVTITPVTETAISAANSNISVVSGESTSTTITFTPSNTTNKSISLSYDENYISASYDENTQTLTITGLAVTKNTTITLTSYNGLTTTITVAVECATVSAPTTSEIPNVTMCSQSPKSLVATYSDATLTTHWYTSSTSLTPISTGNTYTPSQSTSATYSLAWQCTTTASTTTALQMMAFMALLTL